jgi:anti-sigma B factor antagonist
MKIEEETAGDLTILKLHGKLLIGDGVEVLREKVNSLIEAGKVNISLDVGDVPYVDSAGLGEMARCYTAATRNNGSLKLTNIPKRIKDLLKVTRLDKILSDEVD